MKYIVKENVDVDVANASALIQENNAYKYWLIMWKKVILKRRK